MHDVSGKQRMRALDPERRITLERARRAGVLELDAEENRPGRALRVEYAHVGQAVARGFVDVAIQGRRDQFFFFDRRQRKVTDEAAFRAARGYGPASVPDFLGLTGDTASAW